MEKRPNDRQIVEEMVLPATLTAIVTVMRKQLAEDGSETSPVLDRAHALLERALREPVASLPPDRIAKLVRRTKRVTTDVLAPLFEKYPLATQYLTMAYLIAQLSQDDVIRIGAQSPFSEAWDLMTEVMGCVVDKLPEMDEISTSEARNLRTRLATSGYFLGP
ncbi:MAG: hypothetical protein HQL37_04495 [Alphaproteobacteria bacterium]|nr:hypothetical protein [Alphaproteobacteria bacterium]